MAITIDCPNCRAKVRSPEELIGKKVQCPKCSTIFRVEEPNAGVEVVEDIEVVEDEPPRPKRRPPPIEAEVVDDRPRRRRLRDEDDDDEIDERPRRRRRGGEPHRGGTILGLGIASLVVCAPLGFAAWTMGNKDLEAMRRGRMDDSGEGMTNAGRICGMIASILMIVGLGCYAAAFVLAIVTGVGRVR